MKHKHYKLLSLILCFSMVLPTLAFAIPADQMHPATETKRYTRAAEQIPEDESENVQPATPDEAIPPEDQKTFLDYFPDPNFAQSIAEKLQRTAEDYVTNTELLTITSLDSFSRDITSIEGIGILSNLKEFYCNDNQLQDLPVEINRLTHLSVIDFSENKITAKLPEQFYRTTSPIVARQYGIMPALTKDIGDPISADMLLSPLVQQLSSLIDDKLPGYWEITSPTNNTTTLDAVDGSEINSSLFTEIGEYKVKYIWDQSIKTPFCSISDISTERSLTINNTKAQEHDVTLIIRYLDNALPEQTTTYQVVDGEMFQQPFEILEGYILHNKTLRTELDFDVDMNSKTVILSPVLKDHVIELEFKKGEYQVNLKTMYLDGYLPEENQSYLAFHEDKFSQVYDIAEDYQLANVAQLPDNVIVDQENQTITINSVTQNYDITLEFVKKQLDVLITVIYDDGAYQDEVNSYTVSYGDEFSAPFTFERGYVVSKVNFNASGVSINSGRKIISIDKVTSPVRINIRVKK